MRFTTKSLGKARSTEYFVIWCFFFLQGSVPSIDTRNNFDRSPTGARAPCKYHVNYTVSPMLLAPRPAVTFKLYDYTVLHSVVLCTQY